MKLLLLLIALPAFAAERRCYDGATELGWIQSVNTDAQSAARRLNERLHAGKLSFADENTGPEVQFVRKVMVAGDCVLGRPEETQTIIVEGKGSTALMPIVFLRKRDAAKHFGFMLPENFAKLRAVPTYEELTTPSLLNYRGRHRDLTVIYVLCPAGRETACRLRIRHKGLWVKQKGKTAEFPVLAKGQHRRRTGLNGDTPQGVYHFWATMFESETGFGGLPRIDLDASLPPLNAYPYEMNRYVLEEIIPPAALQDYWVNEWPLAYRLGRNHLRLHGSEDPNRPTEGCINLGKRTQELLDLFVSLGLLVKDQVQTRPPEDPKTLGWRVAPGLGKTFVVVKDE